MRRAAALRLAVACPAWRRMTSMKVKDCAPLFVGGLEEPPSCMNLSRVLNPHSGAVRILFLVSSPLVSTIPSPVPMSCSRKSLNG